MTANELQLASKSPLTAQQTNLKRLPARWTIASNALVIVCRGRIPTVNTDHTSGMSPFDLGTSKIEVEANALGSSIAHPGSTDGSPDNAPDSASGSQRSTDLPGPDTEAIEFRVIRPGVPVRRLRLTGNRYTFGSAEGCSIRLNDPTLRPMHAVLIRDAHRVLVRAYSVPLEINGTRITETSLQIGDVMRMGAYRFELLSGIDPVANHDGVGYQRPDDVVMPTHRPTSNGVPPAGAAPLGYPEPAGPVHYGQPAQSGMPGVHSAAPQGMPPGVVPPQMSTAGQMPRAAQLPTPAQMSQMSASEQAAWQAHIRRESAQRRLRQSEVDLRENRYIERETDLRAREAELWARADQVHRRESQLMAQEAAAIQIQEEFIARKEELARLREESRVQQDLLDERQAQIQGMESEYREQVEHATRQLELSQEQAENATQAVQRMREQFASLNEQLEHLTSQQQSLENHDELHLAQQHQLRQDLEAARDEAIDARAESEAKREAAESRVAELEQQLESYENDSRNALEQVAENESLTQQLRDQIEELQSRVNEATAEASQLRADYEGSCASIRQLELLVDQTTSERDEARSSLETESESLRQAVEQLTADLAQANVELNELREVNDTLTGELNQVRQERDDAQADAETRPTTDAWDSLRDELTQANERLEQMQREYSETLARIESDSFAPSFTNSENADNVPTTAELPVDETVVQEETATDSQAPEVAQATENTDVETAPTNELASSDEVASSDDESSSTGIGAVAGGVVAGAAMVGSLFSKPDDTSLADASQDDDSEAWPTYSATASATETADESTETTQDASASDWSAESVDAAEVDEAWDPGPESEYPDTEYAEAEHTEVEHSEPAVDDQMNDSVWRQEGQQDVEQNSHVANWDSEESDSEDAPVWQDESPEVAVSETITDIEQNVDQAIAEIDSLASDITDYSADPESEGDVEPEASIATEPVEAVGDEASEGVDHANAYHDNASHSESQEEAEPYAADNTPDADQVESTVAWNESPPADEATDSQDDVNGYVPINPWASQDDEPTDDSDQASAWGSSSDSESADSSLSEVEGYGAESSIQYDPPVEEETPSAWDQQGESGIAAEPQDDEGSLADQLIRDLGIDASSSNDEPESAEVESTFVMESPAPEVDEDEDSSPWNLATPDEVSSDSDGQNQYGESHEDHTQFETESQYGSEYDNQYEQSDYEAAEDSADQTDASSVADGSYGTDSVEPEAEQAEANAEDDSAGAEDDSIEAYMNRLLQRVQGDDETDTEAKTEISEPSTSESTSTAVVEETAVLESPVEVEVDHNAPLIPRSQAPERNTDMSVMRELANESARSAVARSVRIQARDTQVQAMYKFLAAGVTVLCAALCYWFLSVAGTIIQFGAVIMALVVTVIYIKEGLGLWGEASERIRVAEGNAANADAPVGDAEQQPAE